MKTRTIVPGGERRARSVTPDLSYYWEERESGARIKYTTGRSDGVSGYPRAWDRSGSRVAYSYAFVGFYSGAQIDLRKAREREVATPDENRRAVGLLDPMRDKN